MSNFLDRQTLAKVRAARLNGLSIRAIARELGLDRKTVGRYVEADDGVPCLCGKQAGHDGWCKPLYAKSIVRQSFHAARRGIFIPVPPTPLVPTRISLVVKEKRRWLGLDPFNGPRLPRSEWYGAIGEVNFNTRKVWSEVIEDVRQEMITSAFEGRLPRIDIPRAAPCFMSYFVNYGWRSWRVNVTPGILSHYSNQAFSPWD